MCQCQEVQPDFKLFGENFSLSEFFFFIHLFYIPAAASSILPLKSLSTNFPLPLASPLLFHLYLGKCRSSEYQ